jgi:hypothetical protein
VKEYKRKNTIEIRTEKEKGLRSSWTESNGKLLRHSSSKILPVTLHRHFFFYFFNVHKHKHTLSLFHSVSLSVFVPLSLSVLALSLSVYLSLSLSVSTSVSLCLSLFFFSFILFFHSVYLSSFIKHFAASLGTVVFQTVSVEKRSKRER